MSASLPTFVSLQIFFVTLSSPAKAGREKLMSFEQRQSVYVRELVWLTGVISVRCPPNVSLNLWNPSRVNDPNNLLNREPYLDPPHWLILRNPHDHLCLKNQSQKTFDPGGADPPVDL